MSAQPGTRSARCAGCGGRLSGPAELLYGVCEGCAEHPHPHAGEGGQL